MYWVKPLKYILGHLNLSHVDVFYRFYTCVVNLLVNLIGLKL